MAVLSVEEFLNKIKDRTKDRTDDETLQFIEDATDTINSLNNADEDWKTKYEENDKMWREKYRDRFFSSTGDSVLDGNTGKENDEDDEPEIKESFEDLFTKGE